MQPIDRWKSELDQSLGRLGRPGSAAEAASIRSFFASSFRGLPSDLIDALLEGLETDLPRDREGTLARCATLGSVLMMDYDGGELPAGDWDAIREAFSDAGGEVDLDLLTYAMQLVLDKGRM